MEVNKYSQHSEQFVPKKNLGIGAIIFSILLIILQISLVFYIAYGIDRNIIHTEEFGAIGYAYLMLLVVGVSFIFGIVCLITRRINFFTLSLVTISILLFIEGKFFINAAQRLWPTIAEDQAVFAATEKNFYNNFYNQLNGVHTVIHVDTNPITSQNVLILENGDLITFWPSLPANTTEYFKQKEKKFTDWAKNNLIGQKITIILPLTFYRPFDNIKLCSDFKNIPTPILDSVVQLREKYNISKYQGGYCNIFILSKDEGDILFDNKSLNDWYQS